MCGCGEAANRESEAMDPAGDIRWKPDFVVEPAAQ